MPAGLVEYLGMTPEQRRADYRARLEKGIREKPDDAVARVAMLKLQLAEGKADEGEVRRILALRPSTALLADAGHALLAARQYLLAKEILEQAPVEPDLSIASFRALDLADKYEDARSIIERAMKAASPSAALYWNAVSVAVRNGQSADALRWLGTGKSDDARLLTAAVMAIDGKAEEARRLLRELQAARPEWGPVWIAGKLVSDPAALKKLLLEKSPTDW
jgi:tetratricopeptide (TPR) repeat protein